MGLSLFYYAILTKQRKYAHATLYTQLTGPNCALLACVQHTIENNLSHLPQNPTQTKCVGMLYRYCGSRQKCTGGGTLSHMSISIWLKRNAGVVWRSFRVPSIYLKTHSKKIVSIFQRGVVSVPFNKRSRATCMSQRQKMLAIT